MTIRVQLPTGLLALLMAGLTFWSSLVAPWLERVPATRSTIEAQHDRQCAASHDHGICVQLQHARALPQLAPVDLPHAATIAERKPATSSAAAWFFPSGQQFARAPPHV
ncbi:MAG: hypothetical protein ACREMA_07445 [Longimicrobiales bacterium]